MFQEALRELVEGTEGAIAGLLMDESGIALDRYVREGSDFDIDTIGVEFGVVIGAAKRAAEMLNAGATKEMTVTTDRFSALLRPLGGSYFLALALLPQGNLGKGRYLMRTAAPKLAQQL